MPNGWRGVSRIDLDARPGLSEEPRQDLRRLTPTGNVRSYAA